MNYYLALAAIYAAAGIVQGLTSFGFSVISVPLASALTDTTTAIAYNVVIATIVSAQKAWMLRAHLDIRRTLLFSLVILPFIPVGVLFITRISRDLALGSMGIYIILAAALQAGQNTGVIRRIMRTRTAFWATAALTGLLSGAYSAPGPAVVPYFVSRYDNPLRSQANLSLFFATLVVPVLVLHLTIGEMKPSHLLPGLIFAPVAVAATFFSTRWSQRMHTGVLRLIVVLAMILMGLWMTFTSFL